MSDPKQAILDAVRKKFGGESAMVMSQGNHSQVKEVIPTGIGVFDHYVMGCGGIPVGRLGEIYAESGCGKAQPVSEPVLTPHGFISIGELSVGDYVIGSSGKPTKVTGIYPQGNKSVYEVSTKYGAKTRCCAEHLWTVQTHNDRVRGNRRTISLAEMLGSSLRTSTGRLAYSLPVVSPVEFDSKELPLHPYLLGVLLGGGCITQGAVISNTESDIWDKVSACLPETDISTFDGKLIRIQNKTKTHTSKGYFIGSSTLRAIRELGLDVMSSAKFIPPDYLLGSKDQRLDLLRGLCDTDGYVCKSGTNVEYCTTSHRLAEGVKNLVRSLGGTCSHKTKKSVFTYLGVRKEGKTAHVIRFSLPVVPVSSKKHLSKWRGKKCMHDAISSIRFVREEECVCIKVEAEDSLYVTNDYIVTHNTSLGFAAMAGAQKAGGLAILVETEDALQVERAELFGVDLDQVILLAPGSIEEALNQMVAVLESIPDDIGPNILVWDSIAATGTKASIEGDVGVQKVGEKARILSGGLPKVCKLAAKKRTALLFINQVREKIGVVFGDILTTPGGHTVKFHSSWRMQLSSGKSVKDGTETIGKDVLFISKKNKLSTPFKKAYARLLFDDGWDDAYSTLNFAKDVGAISKQTRNTPKGQLEAREALTKIDKMPWPPLETDDVV